MARAALNQPLLIVRWHVQLRLSAGLLLEELGMLDCVGLWESGSDPWYGATS